MTQEQLNDRDTGAVLQEDTARTNGQDETMATTKAKDTGGRTVASYSELLKQRNALNDQLATLREEEVAAFRMETIARAQELEIDLNSFFNAPRKGRGKGKGVSDLPPKYADGNGNYWSGRGRPAAWMAELIGAGKDKEAYLNPAWQKANQ